MTQQESSPPKRRRWLKWLVGIVGGLVVLVVALYFIVTSGAFFKGFILPKVGRSLNAEVTVSDAEIHPFSSVVLRDLKVTAKGAAPVFAASSVTARYNLRAILGGTIVVDEVVIVAPQVTVIENADGTSNLPQPEPSAPSKPAPAGQAAPPALDIKSIRIENATIRYVKPGETIELTQVNFTATDIKNGATGKLTFGAAIAASKAKSELQAKADAAFTVAFDKNMQPTAVTGAKNVSIDNATGEFAALSKLGLKFDCDVAIDQATQLATIKTLRLAGTQNQRPLMQMELSEPMGITWGKGHEQVKDAMLNFAVTDLNLADWKSLAGDSVPAGIANLKLKVLSQQAGQQLTFELDGRVDRLEMPTMQLDVRVRANGRVDSLQKFNLSEYRLEVVQKNQSVLTATGAGTYDRQTEAADMQVTVKTTLGRLATVLAVTNFTARTGQLELTSRVTTTPQTQTVTGQLTLTDFTGHYDEYRFDKFGTKLDLDLSVKGDQLEIRKVVGQIGGGKVDISGNYDGGKKSGQFAVKLADFRENDLRPFLQPSLGESKLVSVTLNTTATTEFDATGAAAVKADLQIANLVVQDPASRAPAPTLQASLKIDAAAKKSVLTLHQCQLALTPTKRANNELRLSGTVDYAKSNAITGNLKLAATALDLTAYYDLFAATNESKQTTASPAPAQPTTQSNVVVEVKEAEPMTLPFRDFSLVVAIDRCYLRAVDIANLQTTAKLDGGHIVLKPLQLTLNGGPINSTLDLDLGVPGYKYDLVFTADKVPLEPLVDSFSPTYRDSANGMLSGDIQVKGAGTTGRSLRQSLTGKTTLAVKDAKIQIVGPKAKAILGPISLMLGAPELLSSPLDYLDTDLRFGSGKIDMRKFTARSSAVLVESRGTIPIADVLADSPLSQPIDLSLSRKLAQRLHPNTPAEEGYAKWPTMAHLIGTLGDPSTKTFAGQAFDATTNALSKTTSAVKGAFGKVFGGSDTNKASSGTSTNKSLNPLNLFKRSKEQE